MAHCASVMQLLAALEQSKIKAPQPIDESSLSDKEYEYYLMEMECCPLVPLAEKIGVNKTLFLPEPELDDEEVDAIVSKILEVWNVFRLHAELPKSIPQREVYLRLLTVWNEPIEDIFLGSIHFLLYEQDDLELEEFDDDIIENTEYLSN